MPGILVVGARPRSLGEATANRLKSLGWQVRTAGKMEEDVTFDVRDDDQVFALMDQEKPTHVVCTVGINLETPLNMDTATFSLWLMHQMNTNYLGPLKLLNAWLHTRDPAPLGQFVAVSSNSATVPRSTGIGYCASKAALSHAIRCAARAVPKDVIVWALEPGWIVNTPMSEDVDRRLGGRSSARMRGGAEADRHDLAAMITGAFEMAAPHVLNGMTIRLDGGEQ